MHPRSSEGSSGLGLLLILLIIGAIGAYIVYPQYVGEEAVKRIQSAVTERTGTGDGVRFSGTSTTALGNDAIAVYLRDEPEISKVHIDVPVVTIPMSGKNNGVGYGNSDHYSAMRENTAILDALENVGTVRVGFHQVIRGNTKLNIEGSFVQFTKDRYLIVLNLPREVVDKARRDIATLVASYNALAAIAGNPNGGMSTYDYIQNVDIDASGHTIFLSNKNRIMNFSFYPKADGRTIAVEAKDIKCNGRNNCTQPANGEPLESEMSQRKRQFSLDFINDPQISVEGLGFGTTIDSYAIAVSGDINSAKTIQNLLD